MRESRAPSFTAHPCVILAVDPGAKSGWAIFDGGKYATSGMCKSQAGRAFACEIAAGRAKASGLGLVVVAEKWTPGGKFAGARTMAGLGAQWGLWLAAIEAAHIPKSRVVRVHTQTWRAAILQPRRGTRSEQLKLMSIARAEAISGEPYMDDDRADAICIGQWATRAAEVAAKVPKRARKAAA